jgi:hypothetical protein
METYAKQWLTKTGNLLINMNKINAKEKMVSVRKIPLCFNFSV